MSARDQIPRGFPRRCPRCGEVLDLGSPHIEIRGSAVRVFCSERCRKAADRVVESVVLPPPAQPPRRRGAYAAVFFLATALLVLGRDRSRSLVDDAPDRVREAVRRLDARLRAATEAAAAAERREAEAQAEERRWIDALSNDRWVHPLAGPKRRMPVRDSRIFGAARPGNRPIECHGGHCGVDLGGEVWGEPVLAAGDGVVARVQRHPRAGRGGKYVRLSHRDGTVFTQYFHLAAIPRRLKVGVRVEAGEVIGLLGESGVQVSGPHLHFTVSVRKSDDDPEQYIDPEPLLALWPVAVPVFGDVGSIARTHLIPGHPRGPYGRRKRARRHRERVAAAPATGAGSGGDSEGKAGKAGGSAGGSGGRGAAPAADQASPSPAAAP